MSTFGGLMAEFPDVRVDNFRLVTGVRPPLACFLSHVHSDHLAGLETLKAPFIYCSAATREILLRLERYPHRINFQLGILEARKQHYKHLKNLLKPIPLETPTSIELAPGLVIQVTLLDANHCTGGVMFLFEGDGKAVLYTGDIRSEPWFVNNLTRNPLLVEYTTGLKTIDCIYLDTSFTEDISFPTKAEGLKELLQKVSAYPADTKFHFAAWTFGYEEVWIALSRALKSPIHVDKYKMRLYKSLCGKSSTNNDNSGPFIARDGPLLTGYKCANTQQPGCLSSDESVRLHSCEKGLHCPGVDNKTVWIRPIITRTSSGAEIPEMGIGGGAGDLSQRPELEISGDSDVRQLINLFESSESLVYDEMKRKLLAGFQSTGKAVSLDEMGFDREEDELSLENLVKILSKALGRKAEINGAKSETKETELHLPRNITFPYSRHSSYEELCHLVRVFNPRDIFPCTVDKANWHIGVSMKALFGNLCSSTVFRHDQEMFELLNEQVDSEIESEISYETSEDSENSSRADEVCLDEQLYSELNNFPSPPTAHNDWDSGTENGSRSLLDTDKCNRDVSQSNSSEQLESFSEQEKGTATLPQSTSGPPSGSAPNLLWQNYAIKDPQRPRKKRRLNDGDILSEASNNIEDFDDVASDLSVEGISYFDRRDRVYRCQHCGWEVWSPSGECVDCGRGKPAYFEVILQPLVGDHAPVIVDSEEWFPDGVDLKLQSQFTGNYLDGHSAYESSTDSKDADEYEINSFIDDEVRSDHELPEENDNHDSNYRQRYEQLLVEHAALEDVYCSLAVRYEDFKHDIIGSDYEHSGSEVYGDDSEDGYHAVEVETQDPPLSEVFMPEVQADSQTSALSEGRLIARMEVFSGVLNSAGEGWNLSLLSTDDNHTHPEVEL